MRNGFVLLAAGASSRLGRPKALLPYRGTVLIAHVAEQMKRAQIGPVAVVTGAEREGIEAALRDVVFAHNAAWAEGMAGSIRTGVSALLQHYGELESVTLCVCDQPYVTPTLFQALQTAQVQSRKPVIASAYADTLGTPMLFTRSYFEKLLSLDGKSGAKSLIAASPRDVARVAFDLGAVDIDTEEDYRALLRRNV
jgi:molybdenum cofactor cytidylyltransferase